MDNINSKFIIAGPNTVELRCNEDGLWTDCNGTVFALSGDCVSLDPKIRCGVGWASVPGLDDACRAHDYAYSSRAYQLFHNRSEADEMLQSHLEQFGSEQLLAAFFARPFKWAAKVFGGVFWENKKTRNK